MLTGYRSRHILLCAAAAGAGAGLVWAVAARIWMRLISIDPEFTWSGTTLILGIGTVAGLSAGVVYGARVGGRSRRWRAAGAGMLATGLGAGIAFVPMALLTGLAISGRGRRLVRLLAALTATALALVLTWLLRTDVPGVLLARFAVGYLLLGAALGYGVAEVLRRWSPPDDATEPEDGSSTRSSAMSRAGAEWVSAPTAR